MSVSPLNPALSAYLGTVQRPGTDAARGRTEQGAPVQPTATPTAAPRAGAVNIAAPAQPSLPVTAPAGTDPELWSVLTGEERSFFARLGSMGPLTYGRVMQAPNAPPTIRGGRLDVKV
ncbi:MAG TPA: hypothetical protein VFS08_09150 [Gemmatimonadaceae bacterium]|nr:hypothetical protein [Gemmatimonadaceae bacterium]